MLVNSNNQVIFVDLIIYFACYLEISDVLIYTSKLSYFIDYSQCTYMNYKELVLFAFDMWNLTTEVDSISLEPFVTKYLYSQCKNLMLKLQPLMHELIVGYIQHYCMLMQLRS